MLTLIGDDRVREARKLVCGMEQALSERLLHSGVLLQKADTAENGCSTTSCCNNTQQKNFCLFRTGEFFEVDTKQDVDTAPCVRLTLDCKVEYEASKDTTPTSFRLHTDDRTFHLYSESPECIAEWLNVLQKYMPTFGKNNKVIIQYLNYFNYLPDQLRVPRPKCEI